MEVRPGDARLAEEILHRHYLATTGLTDQELSAAGAVFDEHASEVLCPACHCRFVPTSSSCPECGLQFG